MNFGLAFSYVFQDTDWIKKVGIAAAVMLIPVVGPIILGAWALEITRRVIADEQDVLPGWEDFGSYISKGFQAFVVQLAYMLPFILLIICGQLLAAVPTMMADGSNADTMVGISGFLVFCFSCISILLALAASLVIPAALGNLAATGEMGAGFRFNEVFGLVRAGIGPYALSILLVGLAAMVLSPVGSLLCGIGVLITSAYLASLSGHLYGQAYKIARENMAAA